MNEKRAVVKLCQAGAHENIVQLLRHGTFHNDSGWEYYYLDMELCEYNLEVYARDLWTPNSIEKMLSDACSESLLDVKPRMRYIWVIMSQISNGVAFLHRHKEIHRDLKPRNGAPRPG